MKKMNNKKGFTLIELLAVIVILAILVAAAVPAISSYLETARERSMLNDAKTVLKAVKNDVLRVTAEGGTVDSSYDKTDINGVLDGDLLNSPYGDAYTASCYVTTTTDGSDFTVYITDGTKEVGPYTETEIAQNSAAVTPVTP